MECKICLDSYNDLDQKPKIITSCGHTFCESCLNQLRNCPTCRREITGRVINYDILSLLDSNQIAIDPNELKKEIEEYTKCLNAKNEEKLSTCKEMLKQLRDKVNNETERKKEILTKKNHKLMNELDSIETKFNADIISTQNEIQSESDAILAKLNEQLLESIEMNKIKQQIIKMQKKIRLIIENLDKIDLTYTFKPNESDIKIGQIQSSTKMKQQQQEEEIKNNNNKSQMNNTLKVLNGHSSYVSALTILTDGTLASGSWDTTIRLWNHNNGLYNITRILTGHSAYIDSLTCLSDGTLVSGSGDKTIKLWNTSTGKIIKTLEGHTSYIWCLCPLPYNNLASGSGDKTIRIWKTKNSETLKILNGHLDTVSALTLLRDGTLTSGMH